jgi:hypothetical protein
MANWQVYRQESGAKLVYCGELGTEYGYFIGYEDAQKLGEDFGPYKFLLLSDDGDRYHWTEVVGKTTYSIKEEEDNGDNDE